MVNKSALAKKLASYSAMTSAILAASVAKAQVIYTNLNDTIFGIDYNPNGPQSIYLDLNNDGINDIKFKESSSIEVDQFRTRSSSQIGSVIPNLQESISLYSKPVEAGQKIGQSLSWIRNPKQLRLDHYTFYYHPPVSTSSTGTRGGFTRSGSSGNWRSVLNEFLPVKIKDSNEVFFGWVRLSVFRHDMIIHDYAFNLSPNQPILAGQGACDSLLPAPKINPTSDFLCEGDSILLQSDYLLPANFQWYMNGKPISGANDSSYNAKSKGTYFVLIGDSSGCNIVSNDVSIAADTTLQNDSIISENDSVLISTIPSGKNYQWYRNGNLLPNDTAVSIIAGLTGEYTVAVTDNFGCTKISSPYDFIFTQINNINPDFIKLYVFENQLHIQLPDIFYIGQVLKIYNEAGQLVLQQPISSEIFTTDLHALQPGMYVARLEKNGKHITKKFVME